MNTVIRAAEKWTIARRIRSLFAVYFIFLILDFTSGDELFPHFFYVAMRPYNDFWNWIVPWTGAHILHLSYPITVTPNGSGDTTYNYVLQLLWIIFSLLIAIVWLLADRKRLSYYKLNYWSRIVIRYYLAYMLFVYGFVKLIKLQFPFPDLIRLTEAYGHSTPMGLAWTFLGYSSGYNMFTGGAEVLAGALLLFKRTSLLGSVLAIAVMSNVVVMNLFYDIPVKIFSMNLLFMAVWIAWYDKDRLLGIFILHQAIPEKIEKKMFNSKWKKICQLSLKTAFIFFALRATLWANMATAKRYGDARAKTPLYGIYDVQSFLRNKLSVLPLSTDSTRWKRLIIKNRSNIRITNMTDSSEWMKLHVDTILKTVDIISAEDSTGINHMHYKMLKGDFLQLEGNIQKDSIKIILKKYDLGQFPLLNTGFHWINEYPNNK